MTAALLKLNARTFASLKRHRNYRLFFTGQLVSVIGTWMQNIALAWLVIELTSSPVAVGILAFCRFVPFTVFGLFAGVVADRVENRKLVIGTQLVSMLLSAILTVVVLTGSATLWLVYVLAALGGCALVFDAPGRHALTFQLVGREELPNAVALNASLFNASRVVGPRSPGVLIAAFGVGACFAINTVSFLAVLAGAAPDAEGGARAGRRATRSRRRCCARSARGSATRARTPQRAARSSRSSPSSAPSASTST